MKRLAFGLGAAFLLVAAALVIDGLTDEDATADVAIVLGSTVNVDGSLSERLKARLDRALELYRSGAVQIVLVSGGVGKEGHSEGHAMADYLVQQGVPSEALIIDPNGNDTRATAANSACLVRAHGLTTAIAVSQYFHVPRTKLALKTAGIDVRGGAHARYSEWRDIYSVTREVPAFVLYVVRYFRAAPAECPSLPTS